jgi:hypothetical protein
MRARGAAGRGGGEAGQRGIEPGTPDAHGANPLHGSLTAPARGRANLSTRLLIRVVAASGFIWIVAIKLNLG